MADRTTPHHHLAAFAARLSARRLAVELTASGLRVSNPDVPATVTVTCRPRTDDGGRTWFFGPGHEPVAETDQIMNAVTWALARLAADQAGTETAR
ncbi:hypothetical protein [Actinomadura sp. WAC 06369]|uniref:hypothetical protein n=1 Tax=Actinomadura sp. WAC 06369 TaxID=2203193 RepID=UPI000F78752E|nr:hypothetical protein [Actinomadura sp. WAC 06369]RSN46672.1 hypothetical protein DMH08_35415 [Actinomadura sp. WAC 06369]